MSVLTSGLTVCTCCLLWRLVLVVHDSLSVSCASNELVCGWPLLNHVDLTSPALASNYRLCASHSFLLGCLVHLPVINHLDATIAQQVRQATSKDKYK